MNLPEEDAEDLVGKAKEKKMGYQSLIEAYHEIGVSKEHTLHKVMEKCNLSESQAIEKMTLYWVESEC